MSGIIFLVGQCKYGQDSLLKSWEVQGLFESKANAIEASKSYSHDYFFVAPIPVNARLPEVFSEMEGSWFPKLEPEPS